MRINKWSSLCLPITSVPLLAAFLLPQPAFAVPVDALAFTDSAWRTCITGIAEQQNWRSTQDFTQIKCHSTGIRSAEHLAQFYNLTTLSLYNNELTELDVRALKQLSSLNVAGNKLQALQLSGLLKLTTLYGFKNQLSNIDMTGLVALKQLRLMDNKLTVLDISALQALEEGHLFNNQLQTLDIKRLGNLKFLDVRQNPMPDELYDEFDAMEGITISHDGNADDWK